MQQRVGEIRQEFQQVSAELRNEMRQMTAEMRQQMESIHHDLVKLKWMLAVVYLLLVATLVVMP